MAEILTADRLFVIDNSDFFTTPMETGDIGNEEEEALLSDKTEQEGENDKTMINNAPELSEQTTKQANTSSDGNNCHKTSSQQKVINAPEIASPPSKQAPKRRNLIRMMS